VGLIHDQLGRFVARRGKGGVGRRFIAPHLSDYTFAPDPRKWNEVIVTSSDRQRSQGATRPIEIALAKRYLKSKLRYVFGFARIFGDDRPDRGAQGVRISMPVELDRRTIRSHV